MGVSLRCDITGVEAAACTSHSFFFFRYMYMSPKAPAMAVRTIPAKIGHVRNKPPDGLKSGGLTGTDAIGVCCTPLGTVT